MKVSRVSEIRELDRRATEDFGIPPEILMENAGAAVYSVILRECGIKSKKFVFFCGTGNNGGDGLVVARQVLSAGGEVKVFSLGEESRLKGAARQNFDILTRLPVEICRLQSIEPARQAVADSDVIIDAIFGTGLSQEVSGIYKEAIELINASGKTVVSIDIPSGVNGDTSQVMGAAVSSDYTITFGLPKIGNMLYPGFELGGKLYASHISFPPALYNTDSIKVQMNSPVALPPRGKDTHKGTYGKALFIAGSANYLGAPYFAALSFLKAGGGLSYLATPKSISSFVAAKSGEIVFLPQAETSTGSLALPAGEDILSFSLTVDIVVIGPGLSLNEETQALVRKLVKDIEAPVLIDGDGITAIAGDVSLIAARRAPTILTPHVSEMARITGIPVGDITQDKVNILQKTARALNATIVLKGAHSLIGYPDEAVYINTSGNPGMATAGSGDILTGTIAAMFGLGLPLREAIRTGVFVHGLAGDLAAQDKGEDGLTAQDILDCLPRAIRYYRQNLSQIAETFYGSIHAA